MEQFKKLSLEGPRAGEFQASSVNMATAYGCVNQLFERAPLKANLMPVGVLKEAMWKRKVPYFAIGAGLAAAAAGAMFIRPLLDSTAFEGAERPPVIGSVVSEAKILADKAKDAQVTTDASDLMGAAEIVGLVDDRALYAMILDDTSGLITRVQSAAQTEIDNETPIGRQLQGAGAFTLVSLETDYLDSPEETAGAVNTGRRGGRGGSDGGDSQSDLLARIGKLRRVKVTAEFDIPLPATSAGGFRDDFVEPILRDILPGLRDQYSIVYDKDTFWTGGETDATPGGRTSRPKPPRQPTRGNTSTTSGSTNINTLAPLKFPASEQSADTTRVTITWFAVLDLSANEGDE